MGFYIIISGQRMLVENKGAEWGFLGPYEVVAKIEEGSQAMILLGQYNEKYYGLKVYKHGHTGRSCFQKQIEILCCLHDELVVKPIAMYTFSPPHLHLQGQSNLDLQPFLVMQYYRNGDLRHFINSSLMPLPVRNHIIKSMARCLQATQHCGVLHRDIKPENFLIGHNYDLKLIDFGSGMRVDEQVQDLVGTTNYIAPQIYKSKSYSYKSEIFAIGVICFELAMGRKNAFPFKEAKISDCNFLLLKQKMYDRFWAKFPGCQIEPELKQFLQRILAPNPQDRPSLNEILQENCLKTVASQEECAQYFESTRPPSKIPEYKEYNCITF